MFNISDVLIDKEEVALALNLTVQIPEGEISVSEPEITEQITVSDSDDSVPKPHMNFIIEKVANLLETQGIACCQCRKTKYQLSKLSDRKGIYSLKIICPYGNAGYRFELHVTPQAASDPPSLFARTKTEELKGGMNHA